jgi:hypothetical protein
MLHTKMHPTSCLFGPRFVWNPFFLLAGALLFDEKIHQSAALFWFGLRDVGILQMFYSPAVIKRTIVWRKRSRFFPIQTVIRTSERNKSAHLTKV